MRRYARDSRTRLYRRVARRLLVARRLGSRGLILFRAKFVFARTVSVVFVFGAFAVGGPGYVWLVLRRPGISARGVFARIRPKFGVARGYRGWLRLPR